MSDKWNERASRITDTWLAYRDPISLTKWLAAALAEVEKETRARTIEECAKAAWDCHIPKRRIAPTITFARECIADAIRALAGREG